MSNPGLMVAPPGEIRCLKLRGGFQTGPHGARVDTDCFFSFSSAGDQAQDCTLARLVLDH